jgi:two-component system, response regulator
LNNTTVEILLVEDNPNDVELTLHAFNKHHLANSIKVVRDGEEALNYIFGPWQDDPSKAIEVAPKVILLDLKLPKVDGLEVLKKIKADVRTKIIPVVVLTSSHEERDIIESYTLGVNSYIVKPVDFEKFIESMRMLGMYWLMLNQPPKI